MSVVLEGWLVKESSSLALKRISLSGLHSQRRFVRVTSDGYLRYFKREDSPLDEACGEINLTRLEYLRIHVDHSANNSFELKENDSERIAYVFVCTNSSEAAKWVHSMNMLRDAVSASEPSAPPSPSHSSGRLSANRTPLSVSQKQQLRRDEDIILEATMSKKSRGRSLLSAAAGANRWAERRFCIYWPEQVIVYHENQSVKGEFNLDENCSVRKVGPEDDDGKHPHLFELRNSSSGDVLRCAADSGWRMDKWVEVIQQVLAGTYAPVAPATAAAAVLEGSKASSPRPRPRMSAMQPETKAALTVLAQLSPLCADCATPDPTWASVNNGVLICTACSGVHRSLGVKVSFVQSLKLDLWTDENVRLMRSQGPNELANLELEYHVPAEFKKPTSRASRETRATYITAKYATKSFGRRPVGEDAAEAGAGVAGGAETTERERLPPVFSDEEVAPGDKSIGELEFIGILLVKLVECTNLEKADFLGKSDPYVLLTTGHQTVRSKKITNTLNPRFDETLMLSWDGASTLIAQVMDHDTFKKHDPLGSLTLAIADEEELVHEGTLVIADRPLEGVSRGKITLEITFQRL